MFWKLKTKIKNTYIFNYVHSRSSLQTGVRPRPSCCRSLEPVVIDVDDDEEGGEKDKDGGQQSDDIVCLSQTAPVPAPMPNTIIRIVVAPPLIPPPPRNTMVEKKTFFTNLNFPFYFCQ